MRALSAMASEFVPVSEIVVSKMHPCFRFSLLLSQETSSYVRCCQHNSYQLILSSWTRVEISATAQPLLECSHQNRLTSLLLLKPGNYRKFIVLPCYHASAIPARAVCVLSFGLWMTSSSKGLCWWQRLFPETQTPRFRIWKSGICQHKYVFYFILHTFFLFCTARFEFLNFPSNLESWV